MVFSSIEFDKRSTFLLVSSVKQACSNQVSDTVIIVLKTKFSTAFDEGRVISR